MNTNFTNTLLGESNYEQAYDLHLKLLLADRQILARILKYSVSEFFDFSIEEIMRSIDGIEISKQTLDPAWVYGKVHMDSTEDVSAGEGVVYYDVRFRAIVPEIICHVLIDVEGQRIANPGKLGYHLENRMVYYLARMISAQKEREFSGQDYDNIKKVKSIWICLDKISQDGCIEEFKFTREVLYGKASKMAVPDLMRGIVIHIREQEHFSDSKNKLIAMLEDVISKQDNEVKLNRIVQEYGIIRTVELEKEAFDMTGFGEAIAERYEAKGKAEATTDMINIAKALREGKTDAEIVELYNVTLEQIDDVRLIRV